VKLERSAGVLLYRDADTSAAQDAITTQDATSQRRFLLLDYGGHWDYPKGHVEPGEDDITAALRELREETGITEAALHPSFKQEIEYVFRGRRGDLIKKTVVFFLARTSKREVTLSEEHVAYAWDTAEVARVKLTFANARAVLDAGIKILRSETAPVPNTG